MHSFGYLFREGLKGLWKNRTMSIASIAVLISCLLLTGVAGLLTLDLSATMASVEGNNTLTVYLEQNLPALTAVKVGEELRQIENVSDCTLVPKDDALANVIASIGDGEEEEDGDYSDLFNSMKGSGNPLPDAYTLSLVDLSRYDETVENIKAVEGVSTVSDYSSVATKLSNLNRLVRYGSIAIVIVLAVVSLFIISNTIKVTLFSRRMEIQIMKSVGATNGFVRIPFIVEGLVIGLLSGAISAVVLYFSYGKAVEVVYDLAPFLTVIDIKPYAVWLYLAYILVGMLFGVLGGVISISKYLKREGENAVD